MKKTAWRMHELVEQKLEELVAEATGGGQEIRSDIGGDFR